MLGIKIDRLEKVKAWMTYLGWSEGGGPGALKEFWDGHLAKHSDGDYYTELKMVMEFINMEEDRRQRVVYGPYNYPQIQQDQTKWTPMQTSNTYGTTIP